MLTFSNALFAILINHKKAKSSKKIEEYPKAIMLRIPLANVNSIAMIHITTEPIFKHLLFILRPAPRVSDPAMIMKMPDQIPPALMLPHQLVAATSMIMPIKNVMIPLVRIMLPREEIRCYSQMIPVEN